MPAGSARRDSCRRGPPRGWGGAALLALLLLGSCAPSEADWVDELQARDPFVRSLALVALDVPVWQDPDRVADALLPLLSDETEEIRLRTQALVRGHAAQALPTVLRYVAGSVNTMSPELAAFVEEQGALAIPALQAALQVEDAPGGPQLVWLLGRLGPAADEALIQLSRDERPGFRLAVARALAPAASRSEAVLGALLELQRRDDQVRSITLPACVKALAVELARNDVEASRAAAARLDALGPGAVREILSQLGSPRPAVRQAVESWCSARREQLLPAALAAFRQPDEPPRVLHYLELARHVRAFGPDAAGDLLTRLASADPAERVASAVALSAFADARLPLRVELLALFEDPVSEVAVAAGYALLQLGLEPGSLDALALRAGELPPEAGVALGAAVTGELLRELGRAPEATRASARERTDAWLRQRGSLQAAWLRAVELWAVEADLREEAAHATERLAAPAQAATAVPSGGGD